jgi:hypothetical protein
MSISGQGHMERSLVLVTLATGKKRLMENHSAFTVSDTLQAPRHV